MGVSSIMAWTGQSMDRYHGNTVHGQAVQWAVAKRAGLHMPDCTWVCPCVQAVLMNGHTSQCRSVILLQHHWGQAALDLQRKVDR